MGTLLATGAASVNVDGEAYTHTATLTGGSATVSYTDIDGIEEDPATTPVVIVTGTAAGQAVGVTAAGTSQFTVDDGTTDGSNDVNVLVVVPDTE